MKHVATEGCAPRGTEQWGSHARHHDTTAQLQRRQSTNARVQCAMVHVQRAPGGMGEAEPARVSQGGGCLHTSRQWCILRCLDVHIIR